MCVAAVAMGVVCSGRCPRHGGRVFCSWCRPWGMFFGGMSNRKRPLCILEVDELVRRTDENIPQKVPKYESMSRKSYLWTRPKPYCDAPPFVTLFLEK